MKKTFKKFLSLLLVCSIIFTTNSFTTFADVLNNEETEIVTETETTIEENTENEVESNFVSPEEETDESKVGVSLRARSEYEEENTETPIMDELSESESTEYAEEPEADETTVETSVGVSLRALEETEPAEDVEANSEIFEEEVEETSEYVEELELDAEDTEIEKTTEGETTEETLVEVVDTSLAETIAPVTLGDGDNYKFTFKMQDGFGWYNSEDGDTTIEYDSSDDIVIPAVYPVAGPSAGYIWIDYGWAKDVGGHSGPMMTENQLQELINTWKTDPTEDITIYPNFEHFNEGNIKTPPSKLNYAVGQDIDPTGIVFELTKGDIKKEVPYALPQYGRLYSREILNAAKESLGWDTVTADTKYCRFHFDDMIYQDVELTVNVPHTFTFFTNELYPEDFGYFDAAHTINKIEYKSEELDTKPIEIPLVYIMQDSGAGVWLDVGWLLYKGEHTQEEWLSDKQLETLVNNWTKNPNEDVRVRVSFNTIYHTSVKKNPNRTTYHIGEEIDPSGLVIEASDEIFDPPTWTKDVAYDAVQYKDLFSRELLNADKDSIGWDIVTADTKYCRFHFASGGVYEDVELDVKVPHTFTFITNPINPSEFGYFDEAQTIWKIEYKSEELDTKPIEIPLVYVVDISASQMEWIDVGWKDWISDTHEEWISDDQLKKLVNDWSKNPDRDVKIYVNFEHYSDVVVKKKPDRLEYHVGEELDLTGLELQLLDVYDEVLKVVSYDQVQYKRLMSTQLIDADGNVISSNTVTADTKYGRYRFNETKYKDIELTVLKGVSEISLVKEQNWKEYSAGENFDPKGLVIHVKYDDGEEADVAYEDKRVLFLFEPFTLPAGTSQVNVIFGGKTAPTPVTMYDGVFVLYYYNKNTDSVHSVPTYAGDETNLQNALDSAESEGATGFYKISASGYYDAYKKYNKNAKKNLTKDQALAVYRDEFDGNNNIYIGASFAKPSPPSPGGGGDSGGGSSGNTDGPIPRVLQNQNNNIIPSVNKIPQNELLFNRELVYVLFTAPDNVEKVITKVTDQNGNEGFGMWLRYPTTTTWFFLSGPANGDPMYGTSGFLKGGSYYLGWKGQYQWYTFNENGICEY